MPSAIKFRDPVSGLTHLFGAIAALIGLGVLLAVGWSQPGMRLSLFLYGLTLVLMFASSAAYHLVTAEPHVIILLRKLDHAAIYLLIAGTYTPICIYYFNGFWRWGILAIVWALALVGVTVKMFLIRTPRRLTAGVYLLMGWLSLAAIGQMLAAIPLGALLGLLAGGIIFSLGAVVYITKIFDFRPGVFGFHEVWHIFVFLGTVSHYLMILVYIASR